MKIQQLDIKNEQYIKEHFALSAFASKVLSSMSLSEQQLASLNDDTIIKDIKIEQLTPILNRLKQAKINGDKVLVCGDYDCDGVCATTIMQDALQRYGIVSGYYIPDRFKEGYGLHPNTVRTAHDKGYSIIITVDNGVKAKAALSLAKGYNIDVILTDHHHYEKEDLICDYFLHPNELGEYFEGMCGAGIAFLLAKALVGYVEEHVVLACVATIGDIVPLFKMNRTLVKEGIKLLNDGKCNAIQCLQSDQQNWDATKIAFQIVPKLNCVGRLADRANVNTLVKYLLSKDNIEINRFAKQLEGLNESRKTMTQEMEEVATNCIEDTPFLIVTSEQFHEGLNGILASKLCNTYHKPTMVLTMHEGVYKGSIRSNTVDLTTFFEGASEWLLSYGGHKQAAGISFREEALASIKRYANTYCMDYIEEKIYDCILVTKEEITIANWESLQVLEPFGCGFALPLFYIEDTITEIQSLSKGKHIKYSNESMQYLYFNQGNRISIDKKDKCYQFLGKFQCNTFRNQKSMNMIVDYLVD